MSSKNKTKDTKQAATPATTDDLDALVSSIIDLIAPLQALHQQAVNAHAPTVRKILLSRSRDTRLIEHTLDHLLDHACTSDGLALYKSLCRYYWDINPQATASCVNAYRERWDSDAAQTQTGQQNP